MRSMGGNTLWIARARMDLAVPLLPEMRTPPMAGFTVANTECGADLSGAVQVDVTKNVSNLMQQACSLLCFSHLQPVGEQA